MRSVSSHWPQRANVYVYYLPTHIPNHINTKTKTYLHYIIVDNWQIQPTHKSAHLLSLLFALQALNAYLVSTVQKKTQSRTIRHPHHPLCHRRSNGGEPDANWETGVHSAVLLFLHTLMYPTTIVFFRTVRATPEAQPATGTGGDANRSPSALNGQHQHHRRWQSSHQLRAPQNSS